jgi:uncharacterized protein YaaR (DUF327 family)
MKIDPIGNSENDAEKELEKLSAVSAYFAPALNERIKKVTDPVLRSEMSLFIVDVEEKGKKLLGSKNRKEFDEYKTAVKKFMDKMVSTSFKVEEKQGRQKDGKFVVYLMTQRVDEALENLGQLLLAGQQDSMRILTVLDEIRGILMDIYL